MHAHGLSAVFPFNHPSMKYVREVPLLGFFTLSYHAVDVFWILSGFLCEYQLNVKVDKTKSLWPLWFILNRLLRLYPLYLLNLIIVLSTPLSLKCKTPRDIFSAFFLLETLFTDETVKDVVAGKCAWIGWTVNVDFQGYIFLILLSIIITNIKYKKYFLRICYLLSCLYTLNMCFTLNLRWPVQFNCIENNDPQSLKELFTKHPEYKSVIPNPFEFYPDYDDVMLPQWVDYRERMNIWYYEYYFSSITRHGAAMFLGSLLAINLLQNYEKNQVNNYLLWYKNVGKILFSSIPFYFATQGTQYPTDHSPLWTVLYNQLFLFATFLLIDGLLSIVYHFKKSNLSYVVNIILGNKIWKYLSKYTYGIFLHHIFPMAIFVTSKYPSNVEGGGIGADNYGYCYIFKIASIGFVSSLFSSFVFHWILEYPALLFRRKYVQPRYLAKKIQKQKSQ